MNQTDRGSYRTKETLAKQFTHSCLGQIIIIAVVLGFIMLITNITRPSDETMMEEMTDNVLQCIEERDSLHNDWTDLVVANARYMFTTSDSTEESQMMKLFYKYGNRLEYHTHAFYKTVSLYNNFTPAGKRCGIGLLGMVIPMLDYNDMILNEMVMKTDSVMQHYVKTVIDTVDLGEDPLLEPYQYTPPTRGK